MVVTESAVKSEYNYNQRYYKRYNEKKMCYTELICLIFFFLLSFKLPIYVDPMSISANDCEMRRVPFLMLGALRGRGDKFHSHLFYDEKYTF